MRSSLIESRPRGDKEPSYTNPSSIVRPQRQQLHPRPPGISSPARAGARGLQPSRGLSLHPVEGWSAFALLAIAVYAVVVSLIQAGWVDGSVVLLLSTAAGLLLGLGVARVTHFPQSLLHLSACLLGYWLSIFLASSVAFHIPWQTLLVDLRSIIGGSLLSSPVLGSQMIFLFYLSFLSFFLGYFGTWLIYRARMPWLVALVYCSIMLVNLQAARSDLSLTLVVMLAALLLLIGRMQLSNQLVRWMQEGLHTDRSWLRGLTRRFMRVTALLAAVAILLCLILPVFAQPQAGVSFWNELDTAWNSILRNPASLANPGSLIQGSGSSNFFGDQLSITGSVNLPAGEVLYYTSTGGSAHGQYLESVAYDQFDGHTWKSTAGASQFYNAGSPLPVESQSDATKVTTVVTIVSPPQGSRPYIFAPSQPSRFSVPTIVYGSGVITAWTQQTPLIANEQYKVTSLVQTATPQDLSATPLLHSPIDAWLGDPNYLLLKNYYLETPIYLSPNVLKVAQQWTQGATSVYQAMNMLVAHLSDPNTFTYSINNPPVPDNVDAVSWLLQTHRGFCTYYATAMTVMARLLGVPARMVSGFSQGYFDQKSKTWVVNGESAHSWVQVYFPGQGWINFDPTPGFSLNNSPSSQPTPVRTVAPTKPGQTVTPTAPKRGTPTNHPAGSGSNGNGTSPQAITGREIVFLTFSLLALVGAILLLALSLFRYRENKRLASSSLIAATYWRLSRLATLVGLSPGASQTPYEYTRQLARRFPQARSALWHITHLFVRERWGSPQHAPGPGEQQSVEKLWPKLRATMLRSLISRRKSFDAKS